MKIRLLAITHKLPAWVKMGYDDYAKRLPAAYAIQVVDIPAEKRNHPADIPKLIEREGEKMLSLIKPNHHVVALDVKGALWSTEQLATTMAAWQQDGRPIDLLIGGPEGLAKACLARAETTWSLSRLTFPHPLVRVIVAEQLYRAFSLLQNHPYHR